ncbi:MAG: leucine-rich repeat domain-containing protein [Promethearchaeia archaeon]
MASADLPEENEGRFSKLKRAVKIGFRKVVPIAVSWATGVIFPPAGAALYSFLKEKIDNNEIPIKISDEALKEACTGNDSIEALQEKLKKILSEKRGLTKEQLEMALSTFLRPLNEAVNDVMEYIKKYPEQLTYLMDEWKAENRELITQLSIDVESGFDDIKAFLSTQSNKIDSIIKKLAVFERLLNRNFTDNAKSIFSVENITLENLKILSKAQLSTIYYSIRSPYDIAFDPNLYVKRESADLAFEDFLLDLTSPYSTKFLFLVLAGAGMGKTWTLTAWVKRLSEMKLENIPEVEKFIPFFFPLRLDFELQLKVLTGTNSIIDAIDKLKIIRESTDTIPILFLDGLDEVHPDIAKSILNNILDLINIQIPIVLSCRDTDWMREEKIIDVQSSLRDYCYEHNISLMSEIEDVACPPSLYLEKFTKSEFIKALERYKIPKEIINTDELNEMVRYPILLRLFSDYYHANGFLPNPSDPKEFSTIFLGTKGSSPEKNILGRLGILGTKRDYLIRFVGEFIKKGPELNTNDLQQLISDTDNFKIIRSSGLIHIEWTPLGAIFKLNPLYEPHLKYMAKLAGLIDSSEKAKKPIVLSKEMITLKQKKFDYFINMGMDNIDLKKFENALDSFQKAKEIGEELSDNKLIEQASEKINFVEDLIKKEKEKEKIIQKFREILKQKIHAPLSTFEEEFNIDSNEIASYLNSFAFFDKESNEYWLNKDEYIKYQIIEFRGAEIHRFEADILEIFEEKVKKVIKCENQLKSSTEFGFLVENNYVTGLSIYEQELYNLPSEIGELTYLKELYLSRDELLEIPESLFKLKSLEILDLSNNSLSLIPDSIEQLSSLKKLWLDGNRLKKLPETITNLKNLVQLGLSMNELVELPESFGNLTSLKVLNIIMNKLSKLPDSILNLNNLEEITLDSEDLQMSSNIIDKLKAKGVNIY